LDGQGKRHNPQQVLRVFLQPEADVTLNPDLRRKTGRKREVFYRGIPTSRRVLAPTGIITPAVPSLTKEHTRP